MPTPSGPEMPNCDVHAKHHFFMPNHLKKAKFLEFGLKIADLATLVTTRCYFTEVNVLAGAPKECGCVWTDSLIMRMRAQILEHWPSVTWECTRITCSLLGSSRDRDIVESMALLLSKGLSKICAPGYLWNRLSKRARTMRVRIIFSRGTKSTFCLSFSDCWRCNANGRTQKENVQCYGNSCKQCLPCEKTLHWANVCFGEHGYFKDWVSRVLNELKPCEF